MVELVYTAHLKCAAVRIVGSSPTKATNLKERRVMEEAIKILQSVHDQAFKVYSINPTDYGQGLTDGLFTALSLLREINEED